MARNGLEGGVAGGICKDLGIGFVGPEVHGSFLTAAI